MRLHDAIQRPKTEQYFIVYIKWTKEQIVAPEVQVVDSWSPALFSPIQSNSSLFV